MRVLDRCPEVHRPQPFRLQRGRYPEAARSVGRPGALADGITGVVASEGFELSRRCAARAHELHFVEDPLGVLVEQRKFHRPDRAGGGVAPHEGAAEQHVLGTNDDRRVLGSFQPVCGLHAAHEDMNIPGTRKPSFSHVTLVQPAEPLSDRIRGLFDQRPHGQTPDEPARHRLRIA